MPERDFQERTEQATPRRRRQARQEGQVARSLELNAAAIICLGFAALYVLGPSLAGKTANLMTYVFTNAPFIALSDNTFYGVFNEATMRFLNIVLPVFVVMIIVAVGINVVQVGFDLSPKVINPRFDKIDPLKGFKRLFSSRSLFMAVRDTLKLTVVGFVAYKVIASEFEGFFLYPDMTIGQLASSLGALTFSIAIKIGICILAIAIIDYLYQRHEYEKSIRMSKQEIKEEMKDTEGNPQMKARIRQIQREMSKKRMMAAVPLADVVVTNPTQIAVALKYEKGADNAPLVVAKGKRLIAQKIRELASEFGVPIVEDKPLARALFKMCDIGDLVPETLYRAVAELLAYVYKLKHKVIN
jgi:flagellar biosynthetic protein FlhB